MKKGEKSSEIAIYSGYKRHMSAGKKRKAAQTDSSAAVTVPPAEFALAQPVIAGYTVRHLLNHEILTAKSLLL